MKNLKEYINEGIFDTDENINNVDESIKDQIERFLKDNFDGASSCKISDKPSTDGGKYEVSSIGNVEVKKTNITSLTNDMFIWTEVAGDFYCHSCHSLTSLKGAPKEVGGRFDCSNCTSLTSLKGAPKRVKYFDCSGCKSLKSLDGAPKEVGGDFSCGYCHSLTSLKGAPKEVGGVFSCYSCKIEFTEEDVKKVSNVKRMISV